jgi:hypothetical protein
MQPSILLFPYLLLFRKWFFFAVPVKRPWACLPSLDPRHLNTGLLAQVHGGLVYGHSLPCGPELDLVSRKPTLEAAT